jgi:hypothetical protein
MNKSLLAAIPTVIVLLFSQLSSALSLETKYRVTFNKTKASLANIPVNYQYQGNCSGRKAQEITKYYAVAFSNNNEVNSLNTRNGDYTFTIKTVKPDESNAAGFVIGTVGDVAFGPDVCLPIYPTLNPELNKIKIHFSWHSSEKADGGLFGGFLSGERQYISEIEISDMTLYTEVECVKTNKEVSASDYALDCRITKESNSQTLNNRLNIIIKD